MNNHVEFVEYTGTFPNLCGGELYLKIDGELYSFGGGCDFPEFWMSGGSVSWGEEGDIINQDKWACNIRRLPDQFKKYIDEIAQVLNENVPWGCCGGCI